MPRIWLPARERSFGEQPKAVGSLRRNDCVKTCLIRLLLICTYLVNCSMTWGIFTTYFAIFLVCFMKIFDFFCVFYFFYFKLKWFCAQHELQLADFTFIIIVTFDFQNTALLEIDTLFHFTRLNDDWCRDLAPTGSYIPFLDWVSSVGCSCSLVQREEKKTLRRRLTTYHSSCWLADLDGLPDVGRYHQQTRMAWHAEWARISAQDFRVFGQCFCFWMSWFSGLFLQIYVSEVRCWSVDAYTIYERKFLFFYFCAKFDVWSFEHRRNC